MESGIEIKCKKKFGQFLLTEEPQIIVNDNETIQLKWNKEFFISLQPNVPYKFTVQFPYSLMNSICGAASFSTQVQPGEIQSYEYHTPFLATSPGSIKRRS